MCSQKNSQKKFLHSFCLVKKNFFCRGLSKPLVNPSPPLPRVNQFEKLNTQNLCAIYALYIVSIFALP